MISENASSVCPLSPSGETNPLEQEFTFAPTTTREDRVPLQLESRGVTAPIPPSSRHRAEQPQQEFWEKLSVFSESIVAKLDTCGRSDIADQIRDCHSIVTYKRCCGCAALSKFYNRCDRLWCPLCTPRLARERREAVEWWTREVSQPKHVVLTCRNSETITRATVRAFKSAFASLRRSAFCRGWRGGFYSLEVTNEGRGWHLHLHALVDARWIDARQLAVEWGKRVGQDFSIVKVKDARDSSYLAEVTKYAVKASQLAAWSGGDVAAFVEAFTGVRTFGVFGSLYGKRTEFRAWLDSILGVKPACECGCTNFKLLSEAELAAFELTHDESRAGRRSNPPPVKPPQLTLFVASSPSNYTVAA